MKVSLKLLCHFIVYTLLCSTCHFSAIYLCQSTYKYYPFFCQKKTTTCALHNKSFHFNEKAESLIIWWCSIPDTFELVLNKEKLLTCVSYMIATVFNGLSIKNCVLWWSHVSTLSPLKFGSTPTVLVLIFLLQQRKR